MYGRGRGVQKGSGGWRGRERPWFVGIIEASSAHIRHCGRHHRRGASANPNKAHPEPAACTIVSTPKGPAAVEQNTIMENWQRLSFADFVKSWSAMDEDLLIANWEELEGCDEVWSNNCMRCRRRCGLVDEFSSNTGRYRCLSTSLMIYTGIFGDCRVLTSAQLFSRTGRHLPHFSHFAVLLKR